MVLWRKVRGGIRCLRENGPVYTVKRILAKFPRRKNKNKAAEAPEELPPEVWKEKLGLTEDTLNVGFVVGSGFGDNLIFTNYLYCFLHRFQEANIQADVFFEMGYSLSGSLLREGVDCRHVYPSVPNGAGRAYDLLFWVNRYPKVMELDEERVRRFSPELNEYALKCRKFELDNRTMFEFSPYFDGLGGTRCELCGIRRIQQPDIGGYLGIGREFAHPLFLLENEEEYLSRYGLEKGKFITLHRGCDSNYSKDAVKLWPLRYYNELIRLLKKNFPGVPLVQLGVSENRCPAMEGVSLSLVGQTSMEQVKILLKNSLLHIDGEGGFVHLRRALNGGKSAVIFGPTSMEFFSYDGNININGNGCSRSCEWLSSDWANHCLRGFSEPPCMLSITPELVMDRISQEMCTDASKMKEEWSVVSNQEDQRRNSVC